MRHDAIRNVYANAVTISGDSDVWDGDGIAVVIDEALVQAEVARLQAEYDSTEYQRLRAPEYPPIGDQLDALFHAGVFPADMAAQLQAVKDKYPND
jgi:hypothetical protein